MINVSELIELEFTPLEFETDNNKVDEDSSDEIRIYSVGVWNACEDKSVEGIMD